MFAYVIHALKLGDLMIIDAENMIVGRLGTYVAKQALLGEEVIVLNSEKAVFSGNESAVLKKYSDLRNMGTYRYGPFILRRPDRFLKRIFRGMLPWKKPRGREAYKRIKCYVGVPQEFKDSNPIHLDEFDVSKLNTTKYVTVGEICKKLNQKEN